jgi:hypothetical protein
MTREDDLEELAINLLSAIAKARALNLPTSAHILSMPLTEVSRALQASVTEQEKMQSCRRSRAGFLPQT